MNEDKEWKDSFVWVAMTGTAIIALLTFLSIKYWIPDYIAHKRAKVNGQFIACTNNCNEILRAISLYASEHNNKYPPNLSCLIPKYLTTIPTCPAAGRDTYSRSYQVSKNLNDFTFFCQGKNHTEVDVSPDSPLCNSQKGLLLDSSEAK